MLVHAFLHLMLLVQNFIRVVLHLSWKFLGLNFEDCCHIHFHSIEVARFLFARWRAWPAGLVRSARRDSFLLPRGRAGGRTYERTAIAAFACFVG